MSNVHLLSVMNIISRLNIWPIDIGSKHLLGRFYYVAALANIREMPIYWKSFCFSLQDVMPKMLFNKIDTLEDCFGLVTEVQYITEKYQ